MRQKLPHKDILSGILLVVLSIILWSISTSFPRLQDGYPGPSLFPRIIGISLGIMGIFLIIRSLPKRRSSAIKKLKRTSAGMARLGVAIGIVSSYPLLVDHVHFIPIMAGLIVLFGFLLKNKAWQAVLTASLSALLIYVLFTKLLGVPL